MIYLNNAASSFPKPREVRDAIRDAVDRPLSSADRGGLDGESPADGLRARLAALLGVADPARICLTPSATFAINTVLLGLFEGRGGHAVVTALDHNSVLRPLARLEAVAGISSTVVAPGEGGAISAAEVAAAIREDTRVVCAPQVANTNGAVLPLAEIARAAADASVPLLVDAAQGAGAIPIDCGALPGEVFVAIAGHKGLFGPTGLGALALPHDRLPQTIVGGTGVLSELALHPTALPLRHEAGTPNHLGAAGLEAGVAWVLASSVARLGRIRDELVRAARVALAEIPGIRLVPLPSDDGRGGIVAFTSAHRPVAEIGYALREAFGVACRDGLHCAPLAHRALGTWPEGTVRFSFSALNTLDEVARAADAVRAVCAP